MNEYLLSIGALGGLMAVLAIVLTIAEKLLVNYGICNININSGDKQLEVEGGQTLLSALYENEIYIPSACGGQGSCGFCKCTVDSGGGPVLPTETDFLSRKEKKAGVRLSCQVKVRKDLEVRIPQDMLNAKIFDATVQSAIMKTHDIVELRFKLDEPATIEHFPGSYVQIEAPTADGTIFRAYSISSPVYDTDVVELNVKLIPEGLGSTYLHSLKEGDKVRFTGPFGEFKLNEDPDTEIICVGGGVGMAPMKNIIFSLYEKWPDRKCKLFFGARSVADTYYYEEYKELAKKHPNFEVIYSLDRPDPEVPDWDGSIGFIHMPLGEMIQGEAPRQAFLCGPPPMINAVTNVLLEKGLPPKEIFFDDFGS